MSIKLLSGATATNGKPADTQASITITAVAGSALVDGETFTIRREDGSAIVFEFDSNSSVTETSILRKVTFAGGDSNSTVATAIATAINASALLCTATSSGATVTVKRQKPGPEGNGGLNSETVANATFAISSAFTGGALVGFPLKGNTPGTPYGWRGQNAGVIQAQSIAGSGAMDITLRVWGRSPKTFKYAPLGSASTVSNRGVLNAQSSIAEDGADNLVHAEPIQGLSAFDRIYLEITVIDGTNTAVDAWLTELGV
jgi:hypothetical protein